MFQHSHGNFPSSEGLFSRGKLRLAHVLLQCRCGVADTGEGGGGEKTGVEGR